MKVLLERHGPNSKRYVDVLLCRKPSERVLTLARRRRLRGKTLLELFKAVGVRELRIKHNKYAIAAVFGGWYSESFGRNLANLDTLLKKLLVLYDQKEGTDRFTGKRRRGRERDISIEIVSKLP